jgi:hypothetical protein
MRWYLGAGELGGVPDLVWETSRECRPSPARRGWGAG